MPFLVMRPCERSRVVHHSLALRFLRGEKLVVFRACKTVRSPPGFLSDSRAALQENLSVWGQFERCVRVALGESPASLTPEPVPAQVRDIKEQALA